MITIRDFVKKYLGKRTDDNGRTDNDGVCYPGTPTPGCNQCPSLIKQFYKQVFGLPIKSIGDAKYYFDNLSNSDYDKIRFRGDVSVCKRGDFIIWGKERGFGYGHIGIVMAYYKGNIFYIDQNSGSGNGNGLGGNAIQVRSTKNDFKGLIGFARFKNISSVVNKDNFDKIVFEKGLYIGENNLKRGKVAEAVFYFLAGYKDNLNNKNWRDLGVSSALNQNITRNDFMIVISRFLKNILNKDINVQDLQNAGIWNGSRPGDYLTGYEFTIIINRVKDFYNL